MSANAMESLQSTTTSPEPTSVPPANQQTSSGPRIDEPSGLGVDPTPSSPTTEQRIDSASFGAPKTLSPSPASEQSSAPEELQKPRDSSQAIRPMKSTSPAPDAPPTTEAKEREAVGEPNITSAPESIRSKSSPSVHVVKQSDVPPALSNATHYVDPNDFEKRFPEDEMGEETGPNARVWRTYLVESEAFDNNMIEEARDGLDALLVFAGLFSGVVTSFVVQTSQSLQQASTDVSASLLFELIAVQRAAANGTPVSSVPPSPLNPSSNFVPKMLDIWVNSLWFVSLALNLVVALGAVLVKQWLHRYVARRSGTPKEQSHMRQYRFDGFEQWQVLAITGWLPVIMHFSLAVFSVGLVLFLNPLQAVLSWTLAVLALIVYMLYITTNLLPILQPQCPYQTPLSDFLCSSLQSLFQKLRAVKRDAHMDDTVSVEALRWLFKASSNPSTCSITQQAIGGLPVTVIDKGPSSLYDELEGDDVLRVLHLSCTKESRLSSAEMYYAHYPVPGMERMVERFLRSYTLLQAWTTELHMPWEVAFAVQNNDLQYILTSIAFNSDRSLYYWDLSKVCLQTILSHSGFSHRPSIWIIIIKNSMRLNVFSSFAEESDLVKVLLPILTWNTSDSQSPAAGPCPMVEAVARYMHEEFCSHLWTICRLSDEWLLPIHQTSRTFTEATPASRALMVTMGVALHQISSGACTVEQQDTHWDNISQVLSQFDEFKWRNDWAALVLFFHDFVECLIEETNICQSNPQRSRAILERRQLVIDMYFKTRSGYLKPSPPSHLHSLPRRLRQLLPLPSQHIDPPIRESLRSEFACLRRAIEGLLCDIPHNTTIDPKKAYPPVLGTIGLALQADCAAAYELVAQFDCLDLLHKYESAEHSPGYSRCSRPHLGRQFITGLINGVVKGTAKTSCIEYLTSNLRRFTILWVAEAACDQSNRLTSIEFPDKELAGLLSHENLQDLQPWLSKLTWPRYGWMADTSSRLELGDESMQEFLEKACQGMIWYHLIETTQAVNKALAGEENTTEPVPISTPADTDANKGKLSRTVQRLLCWRGASQEASSDMELSSVV